MAPTPESLTTISTMTDTDTIPPLPSPESLRIVAARLDLEPLTHEHAAEMFEILKDPLLYKFTGDTPPSDIDTLVRRYEFWEKRRSPDGLQLWLNWIIRERSSGTAVGHAQATVTADCAEIAWVVGTSTQNRGYASEAAQGVVQWLREFGMREIRASIHPGHLASIRVAERAGLTRTDEMIDGEQVWKLSIG